MSELKSMLWEEFKESPWRMIWAIMQIIFIFAINIAIIVLAINLPV